MRPSLRNLIIVLLICAVIIGVGLAQVMYKYKQYHYPSDFSDEFIGNLPFSMLAEPRQSTDLNYRSADSADEIIERSDCVLRVRINPGYEFIDFHFLTSADVLETLYGKAPEYERIYIYESVMLVANTVDEATVWTDGNQNKLLSGQEYILALKRLDFQKGSFKPEHDGRVYMYTDEICSAFPCGHEPKCCVYTMQDYSEDYKNGKEPLRYRDVREFDYCGSKSLINGAMWLYSSMVEKYGEEAFGLAPGQYQGYSQLYPAIPPGHMPEEGSIEWLAAELVRRCCEGRIYFAKFPSYTDIMDRNDETELFIYSSTFESMYAQYTQSTEPRMIAVSIGSSEILRIENETETELTAVVCVKANVGYEEKVSLEDSVFTITVDKERMMITAYDRPQDDGSVFSSLKALALSYKDCSWKDACKKAFDALAAGLDEKGQLP